MSAAKTRRLGPLPLATAAFVALILVVVAGVLLSPRISAGSAQSEHWGTHASASPSASPASSAAGAASGVLDAAKTPVTPPASDSIGNEPQTSLAAAAAVASERQGSSALGEPRASIDPTEIVTADTALGGCNPAYGASGQCLPVIPPSLTAHAKAMADAGLDPASMPHPWTCEEVRTYFPDGIVVRMTGVDPDGLDADADGVACEPTSG